MSIKLEIELETNKAVSSADKLADKLDALSKGVEEIHSRQTKAVEKEAVKASRAQEREALRASRSQERAAEKATAVAEREAAKQTKAAEREATKQARANERAAEREIKAAERARGRQLRALREADKERRRREAFEAKAHAEQSKRRKVQKREEEQAAKDGFWYNFKANIAAQATGKIIEFGAAAIGAAHNLGRARKQQEFFFNAVPRDFKGNDYLEHADALAERFGLHVEETRVKYQRFLSMKQTPEAIDNLIRLSADMRASGKTEDQIEEVYDALNEINVKGVSELNDIATESISKGTGITRKDILKSAAKMLGQDTATEEDLAKMFGKKGLAAEQTQKLFLGAVAASMNVDDPGEKAAEYADKTLAGIEDKAMVKARLVGEKASAALLDSMRPAIVKVAGWLADLDPDKVAKDISETQTQLVDFYSNPFSATSNKAALEGLGNAGSKLLGLGEGLWKALGLGGPSHDVGAQAKETAAAAASNGAEARFAGIGSNMGKGLIKGLATEKTAVAEAGAQLAESAARGAESQLEIKSPSRRAMRIAGYFGDGVAIGLDRSAGAVEDAREAMFAPLLAPVDAPEVGAPAVSAAEAYAAQGVMPSPTATMTAGGATIQVTAPITVQVSAGDNANAASIMAEIRRSMRRDVENMFEEVALQLGGS